MKKLIILSSIILLLVSLSCPRKTAKESGFEIPEGKKRPLKVLYVAPARGTEGISEVREVMVSFNQPMVPLEGVPQFEKSGPLKISPEVKGRFRWRGTSTLFFIPDEPLIGGTKYTCLVPRGTKSLMGSTLQEDYKWDFITARPKFINSKPYNHQRWVEPDHNIYLLFNDRMSAKKAKPFIELIVREPNARQYKHNFKVRSINDKEKEKKSYWKPERTLVIEPDQAFPIGSEVRVELHEGLPAALGKYGMEHKQTLQFKIYNEFTFVELKPELVNPQHALVFEFSNPVVFNEFIEHLSFEPAVKIPEYYKNRDYSTDRLYLYLPLAAATRYKVFIDRSLKDRFGNTLNRDISLTFQTTDYDPSIKVDYGMGIVESYSDKLHPVSFLNINKVTKRLSLLRRDQVIPTLLSREVFYPSRKFQPIFNYQLSQIWKIPSKRNERITLPLDLKEILQNKEAGFVFFEIDALKTLKYANQYYRGLLQVTNIGLTGKFSSENNIIWVTTLQDARPIPDAVIELRDDKNRVLWQGQTDKQGIAITPGWKALGVELKNPWDKPRVWVFARTNNDEAFLASDNGTGIYPYDFGISYDWNPEPERFRTFVFTERGLYKAGEKVHIKGIIREKKKGKWYVSHLIKNVKLVVRNSRDEEVYTTQLPVSSYGSFKTTVEIAKDAPTGWYEILTTAENVNLQKYASFRVEAYRPAQFEVKVKSEKPEYIFGEKFSGIINGMYLYGGPMSDAEVEWTMDLQQAYYSPAGHKGFRFGIDYWDYDEEWAFEGILASGKDKLDKQGNLKITQELTHEKVKSTMRMTLEATITAENRQTISSRTNCLIHRGEYYIGIKPIKKFVELKKEARFEFITTTPQGDLVSGKNLKLEIIRREWLSVRKAGVEGRYEWVCEKKDSVVHTARIKTDNKTVEHTFVPEKTGLYLITAQGEDRRGNTITTTTYFYVTGKGYISWRRSDDDRIEIIADRETYKPGEKAKILVKSPYEQALALVTVEREFVFEHFTREIKGSSGLIELPITTDYLPNVYVSVILIQGRVGFNKFDEAGNDIGKPSFKIGYTNLMVDPQTKHLDIAISSDKEEYRPRDSITINLKVKDNQGKGTQAEVVLAVVDLGVLNLIAFKTPDPFPVFYGARPLSVQTAESRLHIIGQRSYAEKGENRGGGGAGPGFAYRTEFLTTAYYHPSIRTDKNGNAQIKFRLPDNLTTFRIMAIAQTKNSSFGAAETKIRVKKPLLLLEALPRFARLGDQFEAGIVIHNNTHRSGTVKIQTDAENISITGVTEKEIELADGSAKEVRFNYLADHIGDAVFRFKVTLDQEADGLELKIPVIAPKLTEAVALYTQTNDKNTEHIKIPKNIYPDLGYLEITTASTAFVGLEASIEYLIKYPYECLEQKTSRILPFILAEEVINSFKLSALKNQNLRRYVMNALKEYKDFQHYNGGFKFWKDSYRPSPWLTAYVVYALAMAKKKGYAPDQTMINQALDYLQEVLRRNDVDWEYPYNINVQLTTKCFTLYSLALWNKYNYGYLAKLFEKRNQISLFGKTLLLKTAALYDNNYYTQELRRALINKIKMAPTTAHFEESDESGMSWIWHSNVRTTALILEALLQTGGEFVHAEKIIKWLINERKVGRWRSTQENIYVFNAFNTYFTIYEKEKPNFVAKVYLENKEIIQELFHGRELEMRRKALSLKDLPQNKELSVDFEKSGTGRLYYGMRMLYAPKWELKPRDEGIAVFKVIEPLIKDKTSSEFDAGKIYKVTLSVITPQERNFVVVNDPLPAGFEVINTSFDTESKQLLNMMSGGKKRGYSNEYYDEEYDYDYPSWGTFDHWEFYDDRVLLCADALYAGEHTFSYLVRAMTYGEFTMPVTKAEEMYTPEVFGYNRQRTVIVK